MPCNGHDHGKGKGCCSGNINPFQLPPSSDLDFQKKDDLKHKSQHSCCSSSGGCSKKNKQKEENEHQKKQPCGEHTNHAHDGLTKRDDGDSFKLKDKESCCNSSGGCRKNEKKQTPTKQQSNEEDQRTVATIASSAAAASSSCCSTKGKSCSGAKATSSHCGSSHNHAERSIEIAEKALKEDGDAGVDDSLADACCLSDHVDANGKPICSAGIIEADVDSPDPCFCPSDQHHHHHHGGHHKHRQHQNDQHERPNRIAILRENGHVDVYDAKGKVKTFVAEVVQSGVKDPVEFCFSSHGHDGVDELLTPCFDTNGEHGDPEEPCVCGVDTPHLHAHLRNEKTCTDNKKENHDVARLAKLTFHPVASSEEQVPLVESESLPIQCNAHEIKSIFMAGNGHDANKFQLSSQSGPVFQIRHNDHVDTLRHNPRNGSLILDHDCGSCGDHDVHGTLELVSKRSWKNGSSSCQNDNTRMHFYQISKSPLRLLDLLSDFFDMDTERVQILRNAFPQSPKRKACCPPPPCCTSEGCTGIKGSPFGKKRSIRPTNKQEGMKGVGSSPGSGQQAPRTSGRSTFFVSGICCASEIPAINKILEPLKGVEKITINTTNKTVYVHHEFALISADGIKDSLDENGFVCRVVKDGGPSIASKSRSAAVLETVSDASASSSGKSSFFVSGICCASEIPAINKILEPLKGVKKITINVTNKTVYVEHEFAQMSAQGVKEALEGDGFDCRIVKDAEADAIVSKNRSTIMSKYVESTFMVPSLIESSVAERLRHVLREQYSKDHMSHSEVHLPSKTVKIDHNPQLLSADSLIEFLKTEGFDVNLVVDGLVEGIWSEGEDDLIAEHKSKLEWNVALSGFFWIVSMFHLIDTESDWDNLKYTAFVSVVLGIPKIAKKAFMTMKRKQFDTNCMMLFATLGALGLQEYTEAAAVTFLFSISDWLETISTARARSALSTIVRLRPERAKVQDPITSEFVHVPASYVSVGSIVSVRTGDKIPCDGIVVSGSSVVDESSLTGESRPVQKVPDSIVSGGTVNAGLAQLLIKTTSTADDSAVARLIRLVEEAQANRSPTEKLIDDFAKRYTPIVVLLAISMCTFPWIAGLEAGKKWTKIGLVTIVIACPCALIISTPVTYVAGLASAAQRGIVVKGGAHLESLARVKKIAFDKTGTLTEGNFKLLHLRSWGDVNRKEAMEYIYAMEAHASHPLAAAMIAAAKSENVTVPIEWNIEDHQNLEGEGVKARVNGRLVHVGNFRLFERLSLIDEVPSKEAETARSWLNGGGTVGFMSIEGYGIVCSYCVADAVRKEAAMVIAEFQKLGIDVNMLTGDNNKAASAIGQQLGLSPGQIKSNLLPDEKLKLVESMIDTEKQNTTARTHRKKPGLVLMCGDGVNDAPALALADVGVAMGAGAALAMETADVTLLDSNLSKLLKVVKLGRRVTRTIIENVTISFVSKAVVMGFTFAGYSSLWAAIGSDVGTMLLVTFNGMKLLPSKKSVRSGTGFDSWAVKNKHGAEKDGIGFPLMASEKSDIENIRD